jgi:hypothetical protein
LIGNKSKFNKDKKKVQKSLISELITKNFAKHSKTADTLCQKFDIALEDYPQLVEMKIRNSVRYFTNLFLRKKESDKEHLGLDRVENLF